MTISINRPRWSGNRLILVGAAAALLSFQPAIGEEMKLAQMRGYSASGTHQCGSDKGRSCVVTGSGFSNCNDATIVRGVRFGASAAPDRGQLSLVDILSDKGA